MDVRAGTRHTWHAAGPQLTAMISLANFFSFKRTAWTGKELLNYTISDNSHRATIINSLQSLLYEKIDNHGTLNISWKPSRPMNKGNWGAEVNGQIVSMKILLFNANNIHIIINTHVQSPGNNLVIESNFIIWGTSSNAISSNGFMECFTPCVTTPALSGRTLI